MGRRGSDSAGGCQPGAAVSVAEALFGDGLSCVSDIVGWREGDHCSTEGDMARGTSPTLPSALSQQSGGIQGVPVLVYDSELRQGLRDAVGHVSYLRCQLGVEYLRRSGSSAAQRKMGNMASNKKKIGYLVRIRQNQMPRRQRRHAPPSTSRPSRYRRSKRENETESRERVGCQVQQVFRPQSRVRPWS